MLVVQRAMGNVNELKALSAPFLSELHNDEVSEYRRQCRALKVEVNRLRLQVCEFTSVDDSDEEVSDDGDEATAEFDLAAEVRRLEDDLVKLEEKRLKAMDDSQKAIQQMRNMKNRIAELTAAVDAGDVTEEQLNNDIRGLKEEIAGFIDEVKRLRDRHEEDEAEEGRLADELEQAQEITETLRVKVEELEGEALATG